MHIYETIVPVSSIYIKTKLDETRWHDRHLVMTVTKIIHKSQPPKDLYFLFFHLNHLKPSCFRLVCPEVVFDLMMWHNFVFWALTFIKYYKLWKILTVETKGLLTYHGRHDYVLFCFCVCFCFLFFLSFYTYSSVYRCSCNIFCVNFFLIARSLFRWKFRNPLLFHMENY